MKPSMAIGLGPSHIVLDGDPDSPLIFGPCHVLGCTVMRRLRGSSWLFKTELECGPMPNVMVALPNIGGALCSMPQSLADAHYDCHAVTLPRRESR